MDNPRPPPPRAPSRSACPACSFQRKRCPPDCIFAQYFNDQRKVFNIHRLFGLGRVEKLIQETPPEFQNEAAKSISYEAEMRRRFPVDGCSVVKRHLEHQIKQTWIELAAVRGQLQELQRQQYLNSHDLHHALFPNTIPYAGNVHMHAASSSTNIPEATSVQDPNTELNEVFERMYRNSGGGC